MENEKSEMFHLEGELGVISVLPSMHEYENNFKIFQLHSVMRKSLKSQLFEIIAFACQMNQLIVSLSVCQYYH